MYAASVRKGSKQNGRFNFSGHDDLYYGVEIEGSDDLDDDDLDDAVYGDADEVCESNTHHYRNRSQTLKDYVYQQSTHDLAVIVLSLLLSVALTKVCSTAAQRLSQLSSGLPL